jgi:hypothetical protein
MFGTSCANQPKALFLEIPLAATLVLADFSSIWIIQSYDHPFHRV